MEYPTVEDMIKHYGIERVLAEIPVEDAISVYGMDTLLDEIGMDYAVQYFDESSVLEVLNVNHMDHVTPDDCYNTYGTDLLDNFGDGDLWDAMDERWRFVEDYVSNNYSASDVVDAYGDSPYLLEYLIESEVSNDTIAAILMKYSEYKEILGFLDLVKVARKHLLQDMLRVQRDINTEKACDGSGC